MASATLRMLMKVVICIALFTVMPTTLAQCNTDQNPYCAGNAQFEQLCCSPGNICYWSNRNGDPACCAAGTDCSGDGGPAVVVGASPNAATQVVATTYYVESTYTYSTTTPAVVVYTTTPSWETWAPTTTYVQSFDSLSTVPTAAVVVVTSTFPVAGTVAVQTDGAYVTVTQIQVLNEGSQPRIMLYMAFASALVVTAILIG